MIKTKNFLNFCLLPFFIASLNTSESKAETPKNKKDIYLNLSIGNSFEKEYEASGVHKDNSNFKSIWNLDNAFEYGVGLGYDFGVFRAEVDYTKNDSNIRKFTKDSVDLSHTGDFKFESTSFNIIYEILDNPKKYNPFIGIGIGQTNMSPTNSAKLINADLKSWSKSYTHYNLLIGTEYKFTKNIDLFSRINYQLSNENITFAENSYYGLVTDEFKGVSPNILSLRAGITYKF